MCLNLTYHLFLFEEGPRLYLSSFLCLLIRTELL